MLGYGKYTGLHPLLKMLQQLVTQLLVEHLREQLHQIRQYLQCG